MLYVSIIVIAIALIAIVANIIVINKIPIVPVLLSTLVFDVVMAVLLIYCTVNLIWEVM